MHTLMVICLGLLLLGACLLSGHLLGGASGMARAAMVFLPVWLLGAAVNLLIGVRSADYGIAEELPVFVVVFAVPALAAAGLWWRLH